MSVQEQALKRGADDLQDLLEWTLRSDPNLLRQVRSRYRNFCMATRRLIIAAKFPEGKNAGTSRPS